jgi:hypothetical protein
MAVIDILRRYCTRFPVETAPARRREQLARVALESGLKITDAELDELAGEKTAGQSEGRKRAKKQRPSQTGDSTGNKDLKAFEKS